VASILANRERWVHWWTGTTEGDLVTVLDNRPDGKLRRRCHANPTPASMRRLQRLVNYGRCESVDTPPRLRCYAMPTGWTAWVTGRCSLPADYKRAWR